MVWLLILVSSYLGFLLLRSRLSVLSRLTLDSVHLLDGLLEAGEDDEALEELEDRTFKVLVSLLLLLALALAVVVVCAALAAYLLPFVFHRWKLESQSRS